MQVKPTFDIPLYELPNVAFREVEKQIKRNFTAAVAHSKLTFTPFGKNQTEQTLSTKIYGITPHIMVRGDNMYATVNITFDLNGKKVTKKFIEDDPIAKKLERNVFGILPDKYFKIPEPKPMQRPGILTDHDTHNPVNLRQVDLAAARFTQHSPEPTTSFELHTRFAFAKLFGAMPEKRQSTPTQASRFTRPLMRVSPRINLRYENYLRLLNKHKGEPPEDN